MSESTSNELRIQTIAELLRENGYRAKVDLESKAIRTATGGLRVSLYIWGDSVQIRLTFEGKGTEMQLRHVNEFNSKYRFAKMYFRC